MRGFGGGVGRPGSGLDLDGRTKTSGLGNVLLWLSRKEPSPASRSLSETSIDLSEVDPATFSIEISATLSISSFLIGAPPLRGGQPAGMFAVLPLEETSLVVSAEFCKAARRGGQPVGDAVSLPSPRERGGHFPRGDAVSRGEREEEDSALRGDNADNRGMAGDTSFGVAGVDVDCAGGDNSDGV